MEWGRGAGLRNSQGGAQPCPPLGEDDAPQTPWQRGSPAVSRGATLESPGNTFYCGKMHLT